MPRRTPFRDVSVQELPETTTQTATMQRPVAVPDAADLIDGMEHLRQGTREQYDSEWVEIADGDSWAFTHDLGEIPWVVDVVGSTASDGKLATDRNADVTVAKTDTTVTVTSNVGTGEALYFKVRAM